MRGFLSGAIWGLVVSAVALSALSLLSPVAPRPDVDSESPIAAAPADPGAADSGVAPSDPDRAVGDSTPAAPEIPPGEVTQPEAGRETARLPEVSPIPAAPSGQTAESGSAAPAEDQAPAPAPMPDAPDAVAPETAAPRPGISPETPEVAGNGPELATAAPQAEAAPELPPSDGAEPDAPRHQPVMDAPGIEAAPEAAAAPETDPVDVASDPVAGTAAPEGESAPARPAAVPTGGAPASAPTAVGAPRAEAAPQVSPESAAPPAPDTAPPVDKAAPAPEPAPPAATPEEQAPRIAALPPVAASPEAGTRPEPGQPAAAPAQSSGDDRPRLAALPQLGDETTAEGAPGELRPTVGKRVLPLTERGRGGAEQAALPGTDGSVADEMSPLQRYAVPFENPEGKPLMAIVLIDDRGALGVEALQDFPYPLTFAIDPTAPDAAEKMARHRAAGFEVVALIDLPEQATAQDAEVALTASFATLDQALAILEGTGSGIQGNRGLSDQVSDFAGSTGRGLITQGSGLNTVQRLALRDGVKALPVFRDFDGAGQSPTVMRRFLDHAAFRASQEGGVVMLGRVRPATISALLLWGLQDRAGRVALAPVSALLNRAGTEVAAPN